MSSTQNVTEGRQRTIMSYEQALNEIVQPDARYVVVTAENRGPMRGLPAQLGERFVDCGIAEQAMVGLAAGLALVGRVPIVHALAAFLTMRAYEFIRTDVGLPGLPVKLIGSAAGFLSDANGPTHQALEDIALMRAIPGMQIFCPADLEDLMISLPVVLSSPHPSYLRYNPQPEVVKHRSTFEIGQAEIIAAGHDVTILTYGMLLSQALEAMRLLAWEGVSAGVVNLRTLKPIDADAILRAAHGSSLLVTLEDHFLIGGLYSIVAEILVGAGQGARVLPLALPDRWFRPARLEEVLVHEGFAGSQIAARIMDALRGNGS